MPALKSLNSTAETTEKKVELLASCFEKQFINSNQLNANIVAQIQTVETADHTNINDTQLIEINELTNLINSNA